MKKRIAMGMSLDELADIVHLSPSYIGLIERKKRKGTLDTLCRIAYALNIEFEDLFRPADRKQVNPLLDRINAYLPYLDDNDYTYLLDACKFLKMKNDKVIQ